MKPLCFTGPRKYDDLTAPAATRALKAALLRSIASGFDVFVGGMAYGMDTVFAELVIGSGTGTMIGLEFGGFRELFPDIQFWAYIPCKDQTKGWSPEQVQKYQRILALADRVVLVNEEAPCAAWAYFRRNEAMVDISQSVIAVHDTALTKGGTHHAFTYARSKKLPVLVIDPLTGQEKWVTTQE